MNQSEREVILEVGAEGGCLTICGMRLPQGWQFSCQLIDDSAAFLGEPREQHDSETVDSWAKALALLNSYPWQKLYPLQVHPEFREQVLGEVMASSSNGENQYRLSEWKALCGILDG